MAESGSPPTGVTGATRVAGVIGSPVRHSRSPQLVNAAFAAMGIDWVLAAFEVAPGAGRAAVGAARTLGLGGMLVTMPHKEDVTGALDRLTPAAAALGAVNSIAWEGDELVGDNTDGPGLVASLHHDIGVEVGGLRCAVLGAGGAARSVVWALAAAGAAEVVVVNRTPERARAAAALAGETGRVGSAADVGSAELVVNATSVGMGAAPGATGPLPCDPSLLHRGQVVVDLVYQPVVTPFLDAATSRGAQAVDGIGMLVHQAAASVRRFTGVEPPLDVMARAARGPEPSASPPRRLAGTVSETVRNP